MTPLVRLDPQVGDAGLQPERTCLAWRRLALTLLGLSVAGLKFSWPAMGVWALVPSAVVGSSALALVAVSHRRYLDTHRALLHREASGLPDGRRLLATTVIAVVLAALSLLIISVRLP